MMAGEIRCCMAVMDDGYPCNTFTVDNINITSSRPDIEI